MKLSLDLRTALTQTLTPQQIQYLKLLQLPIVQLEQHVLQEIEQNPMLEELNEQELIFESQSEDIVESFEPEPVEANNDIFDADYEGGDYELEKSRIADEAEPFDFYKMLWDDESEYGSKRHKSADYDEEDFEPFQIKDDKSFTEDLLQQFRMLELSDEEFFLGEQIIGNIDSDGYLRRELSEIVEETNSYIAELNFELENKNLKERFNLLSDHDFENPARQLALSRESTQLLSKVYSEHPELKEKYKDIADIISNFDLIKENGYKAFRQVNKEQAERILDLIQHLEPPGIGSRSVKECLIAQCKAIPNPGPAQNLALQILTQEYEAFSKKHYHIIAKHLSVNELDIKDALEVIRRLNPKPGGGDTVSAHNTVIPDFLVERDDESNELIITVNDLHMPQIRLNQAYDRLKKQVQYKQSNKETKDWIRNKYEDAKFLIQALKQRKSTMLKVMTAIAHLQSDFFYYGPSGLKPLIYKIVSEKTGLDISTVCRIVNGKYVQTEFGTFELKFFFSESLPTDEGEEVSTRVIKQIIKEIIDEEQKTKPLSDDKIAQRLKSKGYNVARRTVAKYREQMKIPVARLRREL